jgi:hypothetical protein
MRKRLQLAGLPVITGPMIERVVKALLENGYEVPGVWSPEGCFGRGNPKGLKNGRPFPACRAPQTQVSLHLSVRERRRPLSFTLSRRLLLACVTDSRF